jgi:hypothetical protein
MPGGRRKLELELHHSSGPDRFGLDVVAIASIERFALAPTAAPNYFHVSVHYKVSAIVD